MSLETNNDDRVVRQTEYYSSPFFRLRQSGVFPIIMTIVVIAAFGAVVYYAYQRGTEVGGDGVVPVVVADETPFKVKPEEPGGLDVPFKDALVFEQINEDSDVDANDVESVAEAPEEPIKIAEEEINELAEKTAKVAQKAKEETVETLIAPPKEDLDSAENASEVAAKTAEEIKKRTQDIEKTMDEVLKAVDEIEAEKKAESKANEAKDVKDAELKVAEKTVEDKAPEVVEEKSPEPKTEPEPVKRVTATTKGGESRVQLAAFRSEAQAEQAWNSFVKKYTPLLNTVEFSIIKADLGEKGVYYRLNATNLSKDEARSLCTSIKDKGGSCLVK